MDPCIKGHTEKPCNLMCLTVSQHGTAVSCECRELGKPFFLLCMVQS